MLTRFPVILSRTGCSFSTWEKPPEELELIIELLIRKSLIRFQKLTVC